MIYSIKLILKKVGILYMLYNCWHFCTLTKCECDWIHVENKLILLLAGVRDEAHKAEEGRRHSFSSLQPHQEPGGPCVQREAQPDQDGAGPEHRSPDWHGRTLLLQAQQKQTPRGRRHVLRQARGRPRRTHDPATRRTTPDTRQEDERAQLHAG